MIHPSQINRNNDEKYVFIAEKSMASLQMCC